MHKGTPFFFLAWTAFDLHLFDSGLHFLEAAIEEDKRVTQNWKWLPGSQFVVLNSDGSVAGRTVDGIANRVSSELARFQMIHPNDGMSLTDFIRRFAAPLLENSMFSIVASLYSFFLEFDDRVSELHLRGSTVRGSYQPIYLHLFKGGLILEGILKERLAANRFTLSNPPSNNRIMLGTILQDDAFRNAVGAASGGIGEVDVTTLCTDAQITTAAVSLQTTGRLRNIMGHTLLVDPLPNVLSNYRTLVTREIDAILYVISKLYS